MIRCDSCDRLIDSDLDLKCIQEFAGEKRVRCVDCRRAAQATCANCDHVYKPGDTKNPNAWLCDVFPVAKLDPRSGEAEPSRRRVNEVLRISQPNDLTPCVLFEPLPEHGEAVVKEARGERSVTFRKSDEADKPTSTNAKET